MKRNQRNKGITLIALVVTIIILIILAGVSINLILGQNGIINRAKEAKLGTEIAREKEILQLAMGDIALGNEGNLYFDEASLGRALKNNSGIDGITVEKAGELLYIVTFPDSKRQYEVSADGNVQNAAPKVTDTTPGEFVGTGIGIGAATEAEKDPYLIQSIEDLVALSNNVKAGETYEGKTFKLECDLNFASTNSYVDATSTAFGDINGNGTEEALITELTTGKGFTPIGNSSSNTFNGNIEGAGHIISNLYINDNTSSYVGFIGNYKGASSTIQNLRLENVNISNTSGSGSVGGIVGKAIFQNNNEFIIDNCSVSGNITGVNAGGIIGDCDSYIEVKVTNSYNQAKLKAQSWAGGIIAAPNYCGAYAVTVENCYNTGEIISEGSYANFVGGIVGYSCRTLVIKNCYNTGNVTSINGSHVGGIVGGIQRVATIEDCYNTGKIEGANRVGGIIGGSQSASQEKSSITRCYNTGIVVSSEKTTNTTLEYVAGIIGYDNNTTNISKCYNAGNIQAVKASYVAGIVGEGGLQIQDCYNTASITGKAYIGGISGKGWSNNIARCYNAGELKVKVGSYGCAYLGGIVGYAADSMKIENAYNFGKYTSVDGTEFNNIGGISGSKITNVSNNAYLANNFTVGMYGADDAEDVVERIENDNIEDLYNMVNSNLTTGNGWSLPANQKLPVLSY